MDSDSKKFGKGPRELTGASDLISLYKLLPHHAFFCKRSNPGLISDTHYLYNVVGDTEIRKGEGMQLNQLIEDTFSRESTSSIKPFDLNLLGEAFRLRDAASVDLPPSEKGTPTVAGKSKGDKEKHRSHTEKDKEHKKHKHHHKDRSKEKDKEKKKDKNGPHDSGTEKSKKDRDKKRKHDGNGDINDIQRHKRIQEFKG